MNANTIKRVLFLLISEKPIIVVYLILCIDKLTVKHEEE